jgi:hypothetical protein
MPKRADVGHPQNAGNNGRGFRMPHTLAKAARVGHPCQSGQMWGTRGTSVSDTPPWQNQPGWATQGGNTPALAKTGLGRGTQRDSFVIERKR